MFKKIECTLTKEELENLYYNKKMSQKDLAPLLGVKSDITVRRILHEYGINTNKNQIRSNQTKKGMSDTDFKKYLTDLYINKRYNITEISKIIGVTDSAVRKYFKKYNIPFLGFSRLRFQ